MKLVFFGQSTAYSLEHLQSLQAAHQVIGIVEAVPKGRPPASPLKRFLNIIRREPQLGSLAQSHQIPYFRWQTQKAEDVERFIKQLMPDICCVAAMPRKVPKAWMNIPRLGFINSHPSLLPQYRGPAPWFWQFLNMDQEGGVTVHQMDAEFDTGAVLAQTQIPIQIGDDGLDYLKKTAEAGAQLMTHVLNMLQQGSAQPRSQEHREGLVYAPYPNPTETYIDWDNWPLQRIYHVCRGVHPWYDPFRDAPGFLRAFALRAVAYDSHQNTGVPGTIGLNGGRIWLFLKQGRIKLSLKFSLSRARQYLLS